MCKCKYKEPIGWDIMTVQDYQRASEAASETTRKYLELSRSKEPIQMEKFYNLEKKLWGIINSFNTK